MENKCNSHNCVLPCYRRLESEEDQREDSSNRSLLVQRYSVTTWNNMEVILFKRISKERKNYHFGALEAGKEATMWKETTNFSCFFLNLQLIDFCWAYSTYFRYRPCITNQNNCDPSKLSVIVNKFDCI